MTELEKFGKEVFGVITASCVDGVFEVDLDTLLGIAKKHDLAQCVKYDPEKHKGVEDVAIEDGIEPGDMIWYWGDEWIWYWGRE